MMKQRDTVALRRDTDIRERFESNPGCRRGGRLSGPLSIASRRRLFVAVFAAVSLFFGVSAANASIMLQLVERGSPWVHGAGSHGLYIGHDFTWRTDDRTNFRFESVEMVIDQDNGNVEIQGAMRRLGGPAGELDWLISSLSLEDIEFKRPDGTYEYGAGYDPATNALTTAMFEKFLDGKNPFGTEDWSTESSWGFEWKFLDLELEHPVGTSVIPKDGWSGFSMPAMGHQFVAELHYDAGMGLTFEAWYKNDLANATGGYYNVADTKANVVFLRTTTTTTTPVVPEPSTFVLAFVAASGLIAMRLRKRRR